MRILKALVLILVASSTMSDLALAAKARKRAEPKPAVVEGPIDWGAKATEEIESARNEVAKPSTKSKDLANQTNKTGDTSTAKPVTETQPLTLTDNAASDALPTAATVRAEVDGTRSIIEKSALRFTFLFEPYRPSGTATLAAGQKVAFSNLPSTVLGQVDMRWAPLNLGEVRGRQVSGGGYIAGGFSRQSVPLVAGSGFRYEDVGLNTLRFEGGFVAGTTLGQKWNLEARAGAGQIILSQTSSYAEVVASYNRNYLIGAVDVSYHLAKQFAVVGSVARRTPLSDGTGAIAFDPLTVSGGFLVQVR